MHEEIFGSTFPPVIYLNFPIMLYEYDNAIEFRYAFCVYSWKPSDPCLVSLFVDLNLSSGEGNGFSLSVHPAACSLESLNGIEEIEFYIASIMI